MITKCVLPLTAFLCGMLLAGGAVFLIPQQAPEIAEPVRITVQSDPPGALIFDGSVLAGRSPADLFVHKGENRIIILKRQGYYDRKAVLDAVSAPSVTVKLTELPRGLLSVATEPGGAAVYMDGVYAGASPLRLKGVDEGPHLLRFVRPHYLAEIKTVDVRAGEENKVDISLASKVETFYRSALAVEPENIAFREELAHYYLIQGSVPDSIAEYADAIRRIADIPAGDTVRFAEASRLVNEIRKIKTSHKDVVAILIPELEKTAEKLARRSDVEDNSKTGFARKLAQLGLKESARLLVRTSDRGRKQLSAIHGLEKEATELEKGGNADKAADMYLKVFEQYNRLGLDLYRETALERLEKAFDLMENINRKAGVGYKLFGLYKRLGDKKGMLTSVEKLASIVPEKHLEKEKFENVLRELAGYARAAGDREKISAVFTILLERPFSKNLKEKIRAFEKELFPSKTP